MLEVNVTKFDLEENGMETLFRPWQAGIVTWFLKGHSFITRKAHEFINGAGFNISRASTINFLNSLVEEGLLRYHEETGKGGYHRVYQSVYDVDGFVDEMVKRITDKLQQTFPEIVVTVARKKF